MQLLLHANLVPVIAVMPTGAVLGGEHFDAIADPVSRHRAWVIWDAAMERIRFDGQPPVHPGAHPGLADRTITVGSASRELRMIGCRRSAHSLPPGVGWSVPRANGCSVRATRGWPMSAWCSRQATWSPCCLPGFSCFRGRPGQAT